MSDLDDSPLIQEDEICAFCKADPCECEPGDPDGEAFRGGEAREAERDQQIDCYLELK